ncbi:phage tail tape measure protein [Nocardia sp. NPDC046763]|uniref:phage tail tape measure protein n=1 Tax=Nocardia sp. NPDC046763 TaxID=3155256 RepID=UPI0033E03F3E
MSIPVMVSLDAVAGGFFSVLGQAGTSLTKLGDDSEMAAAKLKKIGTAVAIGVTAAAATIAVKTAEMAADWESAVTHLVTDDGELRENMKMVSDGMLDVAQKTGTSAMALQDAMKPIESSGYHGADALNVLKVAAEGAKVGNAQLTTVTDAMTSIMASFGYKAQDATGVMNALVETVKNGKIRMEDLAGAIGNVAPAAATAHIGLEQVLGAMTTMTSQGTDASKAGTYLRQTITALSAPSAKAATEMRGLGIDVFDLQQHLGDRGLTGTLKILSDAIASHAGPDGAVLVETFKKSKNATSDFQKILANLPPESQTALQAMADMMGGAKSMQAALELTGPAADHFNTAVQNIGNSLHGSGSDVQDWAEIQETAKQKMEEVKATVNALGIKLGEHLLPAVKKVADAFLSSVEFFEKHKTAAEVLIGVIGVGLVLAFGMAAAAAWSFAAAMWATGIPEIVLAIVAAIVVIVIIVIWVKDHWRQAWEDIKQWAKDAADWIVGAWNWLYDKASDIWQGIVDWIKGVWNGLTSWVSGAWHTVTDPIVNGFHWLWDHIVSIWNGIKGFFEQWWPLLLVIFATPVAIIIALWNHFHNAIMGAVHFVWNAIKGFLSTIWDGITSAAQGAWDLFSRYVIQPVQALWGFLVTIWNGAVAFLSGIWSSITSAVSDAWNSIYDTVSNLLNSIWTVITTIGEDIWQAIKAPFVTAWNAIKDMVGEFMDLGKNIVDGVIQGVENAGGALIQKLKDLAHSALNAAKSFLGISSPSRMFADEVGQWIPHGIAEGITAHAGVVGNAITAATDARGLRLGPGPIGGLSAGGFGAAPGGIALTVQFQGPFYGQGGVEQAAADIRDALLRLQVRTPLGFKATA